MTLRRPASWRTSLVGALLALAADIACAAAAAPGTERFLVIGASDGSAAAIAAKSRQLAQSTGHAGLVVQVADCGDARRMFAWAAEVATSEADAQQALQAVRAVVPDAYVKRCRTKAGSLLALHIPAVDASIASVPPTAVNWSEADRVSEAVPLGKAGTIVLERRYEAVADDPLEGRRTRVALAHPGGELVVLAEDCQGARDFARRGDWIAFSCETEQAADHLLHTTRVYTAAGVPVAAVARCRRPVLESAGALRCEREEVDAAGRLRLATQRVRLVPR